MQFDIHCQRNIGGFGSNLYNKGLKISLTLCLSKGLVMEGHMIDKKHR